MRLHKRLFSLLCVFSCLSLVFSNMSLNASASSIIQIDSLTTRALLGDSISGGYVDSSGNYQSCTFDYVEYMTMGDSNLYNSGQYTNGAMFMHYRASINNDLGTVYTDLQPICYVDLGITLQNVSYFEWLAGAWINAYWTTAGISSINNVAYFDTVAPALPDNSLSIGDGAFRTWFQRNRYGSGEVGGFTGINGSSAGYSGCYYKMQSDTPGSLFLDTLQFASCNASNGYLNIFFACPYVNSDFVIPDDDPVYSGYSTGTVSGTISDNGDGTQNIDVTVETDNSGLIGGIIQGIKNLFVPSDEALSDFTDDVQGEFVDHLGGVSEVIDLLDEQGDYLRNAVATDTIYVGQIRAPVGDDEYFELGGWDVELKPEYDSLHVLYDALPFVIDLIAVFAVLNMLRTKFDILLNPEGECISYDS